MRYIWIFLLFGFFGQYTFAQDLKQTIRGTVSEKESGVPLIGVNVMVIASNGESFGASTDENGIYRVPDVPLGRSEVQFSYLGYETITLSNIIVTSGKEVILSVEMEESAIELVAVEVKARRKGELVNEMATVSARQFSVEETDRYAGSRGDPGRMASNFAGVQGADDSRNDIVIRGNSPAGVLWRLNGVNIPNPNHFAIPGTSGGPASILNNKYLANSDFFTGAFPAEYGNSIAGAFDLRMRNGNNEKYEFSGQLGFLGTELFAEGPISKSNRSSFFASYRYSTLQLFSSLNINVGTNATPKYQDGAFRLNFPLKNNSNLAFWGIGGKSSIDIVLSNQEKPDEETLLYGDNDRDQYFASKMGVGGISYSKSFNKSTLLKATLAMTGQQVNATHRVFDRHVNTDGFFVLDTSVNNLNYQFNISKLVANVTVNKKFSRKSSLKYGLYGENYLINLLDSVRTYTRDTLTGKMVFTPWKKRWDADDSAPLLQPFVQYKYKLDDKWTMVAGLTALYFGMNNNSFSPFEPRLGLTYQLTPKDKWAIGLGMHSQIQSPYLYYYGNKIKNGKPIQENKEMGLTKSKQAVLSYDRVLSPTVHLKMETYYQYLSEIPIQVNPSSFSMINVGSGFSRFFSDTTLVNKGVGKNYGVELTIEKSFSRGYYYLLTASIFDSKYKGSDEIWRNTTFNGQYAVNALVAKEFLIKGNNTLNIGSKITYAGGRWYGYPDIQKSIDNQEVIFEDSTFNTRKFRDYFRLDLKLNYKWNRPRMTHEFALDIVNLLGIKNILKLSWAPDHPSGNPIQEEYQLGLLPVFYYKIDF
ncbi:MAG TPA: TonB-dependent receptor [Saprospiraceae bacterium]|nr:TonB-dependent receptor [Saprospiraceae bacterium]